MKKEKRVILIGDLNETPEETLEKINTVGVDGVIVKATKTSTRFTMDGMTKRTIDYAIVKGFKRKTIKIKALKNWHMSDHVAILVTVQV